jgi:hypothetical protein
MLYVAPLPTVAAWVIVTLPALIAEIYGRIVAPVAVEFVGEKTQCEEAVTPLMLALSEVAAVSVIVLASLIGPELTLLKVLPCVDGSMIGASNSPVNELYIALALTL